MLVKFIKEEADLPLRFVHYLLAHKIVERTGVDAVITDKDGDEVTVEIVKPKTTRKKVK